MVGRALKLFGAIGAYLLQAWQSTMRRFIKSVRALARAELAYFSVDKFLAALSADPRGILSLSQRVIVPIGASAIAKAPRLMWVFDLKIFVAMGTDTVTRGNMGHSNSLLVAVAHVPGCFQHRWDNFIGMSLLYHRELA